MKCSREMSKSLIAGQLGSPDDLMQLIEFLVNEAQGRNPSIRQLEAKHELAKNHLKESKAKFDQALDELRVKGFGTLRGEVARDALAVFASGLYRGFNSGACDQYTLSIINYGGLETPAPWYLPSTEELANKAKDYFWECLYQPYAGVPRLSLNGVQPSDA